jgi:predicted porin
MGKLILGLALCLSMILGMLQNSYADRRSYVWTYEYQTMPKGMWELEYYFTSIVPHLEKSNINTLKQWLELEYGITNHWDVAMYQMYKINNKESETDSEYDGFKIRTRYRFARKGKLIVDPLLYLEYIRNPDLHKPNVIEAKLVLAKDFGDINISYNQIFERDLENRGKTEPEYAVGLSYRVTPALRLGIESKGSYSKRETAVGPTLSWSRRKLWVSLGAAWGVNRRTDDLQARMIVGIPF